MAPILLENTAIAQRTLGHDMESFFAIILWIASLNYDDETASQNKLLINIAVEKKHSSDIANAKIRWFRIPREFKVCILDHFDDLYSEDDEFIDCLWDLRQAFYP